MELVFGVWKTKKADGLDWIELGGWLMVLVYEGVFGWFINKSGRRVELWGGCGGRGGQSGLQSSLSRACQQSTVGNRRDTSQRDVFHQLENSLGP